MAKNYRQFTAKERAWLKKFDAVLKSAPDTLFLFVGEGLIVFAKDKDNRRYMTEFDGVDGLAPSESFQTPMEFDGGAF